MDTDGVPNLLYIRGDGCELPMADGAVDLVLCAQVYEHVADAERMAAEIHRVLRPGGICLFSGPNRLDPLERHYGLPFLSWMPRHWADAYVRLAGRGDAYRERPRTYWGLKRLWRGFERRDLTPEMIRYPMTYHCQDELGKLSWVSRLPGWLLRLLAPFYPNYNWVLIKRAGDNA
jgi:SAM-dependent methyltransferase